MRPRSRSADDYSEVITGSDPLLAPCSHTSDGLAVHGARDNLLRLGARLLSKARFELSSVGPRGVALRMSATIKVFRVGDS